MSPQHNNKNVCFFISLSYPPSLSLQLTSHMHVFMFPDDDVGGGSKNRPRMILLWLPIPWSTMKEKDNTFMTESGTDFHNSSGQRWQRTRLVEKKKTLAHRPPWISDPNVVPNGLWIQKRGGVRSRNTRECKTYIRLPGACDGPEEKEKIRWSVCYQSCFGVFLSVVAYWHVQNLVLLVLMWR